MPPRPGPYVSGFLGVAVPTNRDVTSTLANLNDRVEFDPGIFVGGTGGFDFGFARVEGEVSYKHAEISKVTDRINGNTFTDIDGRIGVLAVMGNAFLDLHNPSPITPYFGGGVGFAALHQSNTFGRDNSNIFGTQLYFTDDDDVFAYQVGAGLEMAITTRLSLDVGYRYFRTMEATFNQNTLFEHKLKFESHNAAVGLRVKF
jgi:opacity protein-like surface antigen